MLLKSASSVNVSPCPVNGKVTTITKKFSVPAIKGVVKDKRLSKTAKIAFFTLHSFTNKDGVICWPSIKTASEALGVTRNTIRAGINELLEFAYLSIEKVQLSGRQVTRYTLVRSVEVEVEQEQWNAESPAEPDQLMLPEIKNDSAKAQNPPPVRSKSTPPSDQKVPTKGSNESDLKEGDSPAPSDPMEKFRNYVVDLLPWKQEKLLDQIKEQRRTLKNRHWSEYAGWDSPQYLEKFRLIKQQIQILQDEMGLICS